MKKLFPFSLTVVLLLLGTAIVSAQSMTVELEFTSADTINLVAGDSVCFRLVAKDASGNIVTNWSSLGYWVHVEVQNSIAETDTILAAWGRHHDGYTWSRLVVEGQIAGKVSPDEYTIDPALFINGVANACFTTTGADRNIRLKLLYSANPVPRISPPINVFPAALDNYLVELTNHQWPDRDKFYAFRPVEFVVSPRDRYLNKISNETPVRFDVDFPAEVATIASRPPNPFDPNLVIRHTQNYFLLPTAERESGLPQRIHATHPTDATITGVSDAVYSIPHAPNPFGLQLPADQTTVTLDSAQDRVYFKWYTATIPDPYRNIQTSRFDPTIHSDTVRYRIHFTDEQMSQVVTYDSCDVGSFIRFDLTQQVLDSVITELAGGPVTNFTLVWFVEATDGNYTTRSTPIGQGIAGHRIVITNDLFTGSGILLDANAIGSTTPRVGDEIRFDLQAVTAGNSIPAGTRIDAANSTLAGSPIENWNDVGGCAALYIDGSTAEDDSSMQSWSSDPDAYSWTVLEVSGREIRPVSPRTYIIPPSLFTDGIASVRFRTSKVDPAVQFQALPVDSDLDQSSPSLVMKADALDNFLVELTWHDPAIPGVYVQRPVELIITPRDRYLNTIDEEVPVSLSAVMGSLETHPELGDTLAFHEGRMLHGQTAIYLQGKHTADVREGRGEKIYVTNTEQPMVQSSSAEFSIIPHAPVPFALSTPADLATMNLLVSHREQTFTWERPDPPDAVTNILVSSLLPLTISDDIRYTFHFRDEYFPTRATSFPSDNDGRDPILTITEGRLAAIIDSFAQDPLAKSREVLWFVEATDGMYTTHSTDQLPTLPGNRLKLVKESTGTAVLPIPPQNVDLQQNYPNPFNPSTTVHFSTTKHGAVSLKVYDLLGSEVATIHQGVLEAGEHTARFDASALRSGMYIYRLVAEGQTLSRRMVVLK